ncbi:MAG: bifunctional metallophosphatase/5'-nucleotidase [Gemmatimonadales bacterium]
MHRCFLLLLALTACAPGLATPSRSIDSPRTVMFLHFNDVYEITPVGGGRSGGLARLATVRREILASSPALLTTLGGDYLSPSAMGLAVVDGQRLAGRQMVATLNAVGVDWAVLGNHEFDLRESEFRQRLDESRFRIVTSNVTDSSGALFPGTTRHEIVRILTRGGALRIGMIGLTINSNQPAWVRFENPIDAARREIAALGDSVDAIVALTHLSLAQDQLLAEVLPAITVILGGHEHENYEVRRGARFTPIIKADANVRTVAVITLTWRGGDARPHVESTLRVLDSTTTESPDVARDVAAWVARSDAAYRADGLDPGAVVATITEPLDGRESVVRSRPGPLTALVAGALRREVPGAEVGVMNGGSIRIDDVIPVGVVTQYDVIRILPFGGHVVGTTMTGALLERVLTQGEANRGTGGFLHASGVTREGTRWMVGGVPIDAARSYRVATTDFLLTGRETGLDWLKPGNPGLGPVQPFRDIRVAVIAMLRAR